MLLTFNDVVSQNPVSINPSYVVAVFTATDGEYQGKTIIGLTNGNLLVTQDYLDVVGQLQGELK
jgi:hypothetical protein